MMAYSPPSVSRRLLIAVAVPLLLFFALTVWAIDYVFQQASTDAIHDSLWEQVVALVTAVDIDPNGNILVNVSDPESRLNLPSSGLYATLRDEQGRLLWSSPSIADTGLVLGTKLAKGETSFGYARARNGSLVAALSRGLEVTFGTGQNAVSRRLVFTAAETTAPQVRQLQLFRSRLAGWFGALAAVLLATMAWMMRGALAPVRRLEQEIADVEGGISTQLGGGYPRELAGVTEGLNALLVSERDRIARYRDTLGNLAHSLKTPLAVIRASLGGGDGDSTRSRDTIQQAVDRMAEIVAHQLKRAAASGGATLGQAPVPVLPLISELRAAMLKVHSRKDLRIDVDVPAALGFLGDSGDIMELLGNVIDNACKWCRSQVAISVVLDPDRATSQRLSIVVEDDGPGIAPADRARVFERGVRADEHVPGHGLGLAMVRDTIALYQGRLFLDASAALGGARIELQLPGR